jgi:hypothetical protein
VHGTQLTFRALVDVGAIKEELRGKERFYIQQETYITNNKKRSELLLRKENNNKNRHRLIT